MTSTGAPLDPTVRELIAPDRNPRLTARAASLDAGQLAGLKALIERSLSPGEPFSMIKALTSLAAAEPSPEVCAVLGGFLASTREKATDRVVAAGELGRIARPEAQQVLIASLGEAEPQVRREVIRSLGLFGDREALAALSELPRPAGEGLGRQLDFAKALVAARLGLPETHLPFRPGVERRRPPADELIELTLKPLSRRKVGKDREALQGTTYGIELGERGFRLRAGKARWTVFVNKKLGVGAFLGGAFERPWITALLARWDPPTKTAGVQYVVLTAPRDDAAELMVVRGDGEVFYSGRLQRGRDLLRFAVQDVARAGTAPTNVRGRLSTAGIELDLAVPFGRRRDQSPGAEATAPEPARRAV